MFRRKIAPNIIEVAQTTLNKYRSYDYSTLVSILNKTEETPDHVELIDISENGDEYQITVDANWDDKKVGNIRYDVSAFHVPIKSFFGFPFTSSVDGFIMKSDGTFIDEDGKQPNEMRAQKENNA